MKSASAPAADLCRAYQLMHQHNGHQHWWPGDTPFEICVGAILTQNTSWTNVERAIANLKAAHVLEPKKLYALPETQLAEFLRPAGYFNVKARRLRSFLRVLVEECGGDLKQFFAGDTAAVRHRLLAIKGVGPETADSMLLYAGGHHSFVVDAYTKRIFTRHRWWSAPVQNSKFKVPGSRLPKQKPATHNSRAEYDSLKQLCETTLDEKPRGYRLDYWQDYHAQLVMVGKEFCRARDPRCEQCPLKPLLPGGRLPKVKP